MNMDRKIKFRVWDNTDHHWQIDDYELLFCQEQGDFTYHQEKLGKYHDYTIQQFTGIKDRNCTDIYEGDIVKVDLMNDKVKTITEPVVWGEYGDDEYVDSLECWMIGGYPLSSVAHAWGLRYNGLETKAGSLEVVGNIFDMITLDGMTVLVKQIVKDGNVVCLECIKCGDKALFFEGDIPYLYNKKYLNGCPVCSGAYKIHGHFMEDI